MNGWMNDISTSQCSVQCIVYNVQCIVYNVQCIVYNERIESKFIDRKYQRIKYCEEESELTIIRLEKIK